MYKSTTPVEYHDDMNTNNSTLDDRKKGRFSRFLEKRKEKENEPRPTISNSNTNTDSAYASSENDPLRKTSPDPDFVAVQNHQIPGVAPERSLWLDKNNGEIYDEDTGDVVTTVTTTTTTTTTTTSRGGRKQEVVDVKTTQTEPQAYDAGNRLGGTTGTLGLNARDAGGLNEMPATASHPTTSHTTSVIPPTAGTSNNSYTAPATTTRDNTVHNVSSHSTHPNIGGSLPIRSDHSPPIPSKHPNRISGEFGRHDMSEYEQAHSSLGSPTTPNRHNFSYPSRSGPGGTTEEAPVRTSGSTFANLKAAAIAAHGIGETLRGTLNDAVDSRYPRGNATKAAAVNSKNKSVLDRGRTEMERFNTDGRPTARDDMVGRHSTLDSTTGTGGLGHDNTLGRHSTLNSTTGTGGLGHDSTLGRQSTLDSTPGRHPTIDSTVGGSGIGHNSTVGRHSVLDGTTGTTGGIGHDSTVGRHPTHDSTLGRNSTLDHTVGGGNIGHDNTRGQHSTLNSTTGTGGLGRDSNIGRHSTLDNTVGAGGLGNDSTLGRHSTLDNKVGTGGLGPNTTTGSGLTNHPTYPTSTTQPTTTGHSVSDVTGTSGTTNSGTNPNYHPPTGSMVGNNSATTNAINSEPTTTETTGTKSSGFGKLFKRKPVGETQGSQTAKYF